MALEAKLQNGNSPFAVRDLIRPAKLQPVI